MANAVQKSTVAPSLSGEDLRRALTVVEGIAEGGKVDKLTGGADQPKKGTFYRWLAVYPELKRAFDAAREISAFSFEEEALRLADKLVGDNDFNGTKVRMYEVAMQQLRWSASRRNPHALGDKNTVSVTVPVQINTSLDLGQAGGGAPTPQSSVYEFAAQVQTEAEEAEFEPVPDLEFPDPDDAALTSRFKSDIPRGKGMSTPGRRKGHTKSEAQIKRQITMQKNKAEKDQSK